MIRAKRADIAIAAFLLAATALLFVFRGQAGRQEAGGGLAVEIYVDGELVKVIPLSDQTEEHRLETAYGYNILALENGRAKITEADCASQDCVKAHAMEAPGEMTACLPHRLLVRLAGHKNGAEEVDVVAG